MLIFQKQKQINSVICPTGRVLVAMKHTHKHDICVFPKLKIFIKQKTHTLFIAAIVVQISYRRSALRVWNLNYRVL